jgi:hypothetical protein
VGFDTELGEGEKIAYLPSDLHDHYRSTKRVDWRDHTRMPVILPEDQVDAWLSGEAGKEILVPYPADQMTVWPTSPQVTRTRLTVSLVKAVPIVGLISALLAVPSLAAPFAIRLNFARSKSIVGLMIFVILYLIFCWLIGLLGINRPLGFWAHFICSLLFTPLIGLLLIAAAGDNRAHRERRH